MVFIDGEEHEIKRKKVRLTNIPKLGTQWKVIFDLKPVFVGRGLILSLVDSEIDRAVGSMFCMSSSAICSLNSQGIVEAHRRAYEVPKLCQWTRVEVTHEKVFGRFYLTLSLDGKEVARIEAHPELQRLTNVSIDFHAGGSEDQGSFRRLVVLGNQ